MKKPKEKGIYKIQFYHPSKLNNQIVKMQIQLGECHLVFRFTEKRKQT